MIGPTRGRPLALDRISSEVAQPGAMDQQVLWDFGASVHSFGGPCSATCIKCTTSPAPKRSMYRFAFPRGLGMNSCARCGFRSWHAVRVLCRPADRSISSEIFRPGRGGSSSELRHKHSSHLSEGTSSTPSWSSRRPTVGWVGGSCRLSLGR